MTTPTATGQLAGRPVTEAERLGAVALFAAGQYLIDWDDLKDDDREYYLQEARTVLDAAAAPLLDQVADQIGEAAQDLRDVAAQLRAAHR